MCSAKAVDAAALEEIFDGLFLASENVCLRGGAPEPLYEPADSDRPAFIRYRDDYPASALHEVAHWCIAGRVRRRLPDYGYWYDPDGREGDAQARFQAVEARPQALEWCFSQAAGLRFRISLDNLDTPPSPTHIAGFHRAVIAHGEALRDGGLPPRAQRFFHALGAQFRPAVRPRDLQFDPDVLR